MSSKKPKKQKRKPNSRAPTQTSTTPKKKHPNKSRTSPKTHIKVTLNTPTRNAGNDRKENITDHKRSKSPLSPFTDWYKSHKKSKPKTKRRPQRSQSNRFYSEAPSKYKTKHKKEKVAKPNTPRNQSTRKNKRKHPHDTDPKKQLKFTRKNDKITVVSPKTSKRKTKHKKKSNPPHTIAITQPSNNKKSTSKKQSFAKRASLKFGSSKKKPRALSANPPNSKKRPHSSNRRGSFFSRKSKDRSTKEPKQRKRGKVDKKRKNKSFKDRINVSIKPKTNNHINGAKYAAIEPHAVSLNKFGHTHEIQSSLTAHKLRMVTNALREEIDEDDREESSSLDPDGYNKYTMAIKFKQKQHHRRGSSGIPHFYQKKLAFELGQYLDEKARLFISHFCRLYALRITENLFAIISTFHVMPFDSGFICLTSKDDGKYSSVASVTYYNPLLQIPMRSLSKLLAWDKHQSVPIRPRPQSVPAPPKLRNRSKSFNLINEEKKGKHKGFVVKAPTSKTVKTTFAEVIGLSQSHSIRAYSVDEEVYCDDIDADSAKKQRDLMKIKKYKKRATRKRKKNIGGRLTRSTTFSAEKKKKTKKATRIFYSSASELSDTETYTDTDLCHEGHDAFAEKNYTELLQGNSLPNGMTLQEDAALSDHSITEEYSGTLSVNKLFSKPSPVLNEDTNTTLNTVTNDTPNTITHNKTAELFTDYSPPPSPKGYRSDDTMTPRSMTNDINFFKEFKVTFDEQDTHIISTQSKIKRMKKQWVGLSEKANGVGIAEWTLLSTPKVFDYHNHPKNKQSINCISPRLGIGGFIDRTRGVCGVSLAPIYYRYGGTDIGERYHNKLDIYNLYTGDYIAGCTELPFKNLYHSSSCLVREGYKSTLVITGGLYYGEEVFDDSIIEAKTYFYAPWINSNYHHQISENNSRSKQRRKSITDNKNSTKKVSRTFVNEGNALFDFENIVTRPNSRSIAVTSPSAGVQSQRTRKFSAAKGKGKQLDVAIKDKMLGSDGAWIAGPAMLRSRASHSSVSWDEHIVFCCGGIGDSGRRIANVEMLRMDRFKELSDLKKLRWRKCSPMTANKSNLALIHWKPKTCIVCVGSGSKVVESYDPYKDNWKDLPPLNTHQVSSKSCRFYYDDGANNNCLLFVKFRNGVIKSMEYLDERKKLKKWTLIKDQYVELFNAQINNQNSAYLKNIIPFCFS